MTKESLQKYCDNKGLKIKILYVEEQKKFGDYEVVYTFDLTYEGRDYADLNQIIEPELDELCEDEKEFFFMVQERM